MADSVNTMKGIRKRGEAYEFTVSLGFDGNGKHIRKYSTYRPPEGVSEKQRAKLVQEAYMDFYKRAHGNKMLDENMRFSELAEKYFAEYAPNKLKDVTSYNYSINVKTRINPVFGNMKLKDICTADISTFLTTLPLAPQTTRKTKVVLQSVFRYAVEQKFIQTNPVKGAYYKKDPDDDNDSVGDNYLLIDEVKQLMKVTEDYSTFNVMVRLLLQTGMRSGEVLALRWDCIDFKARTIRIDKTLTVTDHTYLSTPKTKNSRRTIAVEDDVLEMLRHHKQEQDKVKAKLGKLYRFPELVFTTEHGNWHSRKYINDKLKEVLEKNGLRKITVHGLRHTYASMLIYGGEHMQVISRNLGHASCDITSRVYAHVYPEAQAKAAKTISQILNQNLAG